MLKKANEYLQDHLDNVDNSRKGKYHLSAPVGWMNDPNGLCFYHGYFHAFYQYHPYSAVWGPMHWGHQISKDMIKWELLPCALAPDTPYDHDGCFSGSALIEEDTLYLAYTCVANGKQNQALAYSKDGYTFQKVDDNPIIKGELLPSGYSRIDFRDPKIFKRNDHYYILNGTGDEDHQYLVLFKADEVTGIYRYIDAIYDRNDGQGIFECPDLERIDDHDVLIMCPQGLTNDDMYSLQNGGPVIYVIGQLDLDKHQFIVDDPELDYEEFDKGFSFYAPQCFVTPDGRTIMIGWMHCWDDENVSQNDGWAGSLTLPRVLEYRDGHIYQHPIQELSSYYANHEELEGYHLANTHQELPWKDNVCRISLDIIASSGKTGIQVFQGEEHETKVNYDAKLGAVVLDRFNCGSTLTGKRYAKVDPIDGKVHLEIFLDVSSIEIFINDGY